MKVIVVDKNDNPIGVKTRGELTKDDISRVSALVLVNSKNETLLTKRHPSKEHDPDRWSIAVAGTVEEGEDYVTNIIKESEEEIGLEIKEEQLEEVRYSYHETSHKFFVKVYLTKTDKPLSFFKIQEKEVTEIKWISIDEVIKWFNENPKEFTSSFGSSIEILERFRK